MSQELAAALLLTVILVLICLGLKSGKDGME